MSRAGTRRTITSTATGDAERLRRCRCIRLELTNDRGDTLEGYYYPCSGAPCGRIAFIVHGYRSEHLETAGMYYDYYKSRGFDLVHLRPHGCR